MVCYGGGGGGGIMCKRDGIQKKYMEKNKKKETRRIYRQKDRRGGGIKCKRHEIQKK